MRRARRGQAPTENERIEGRVLRKNNGPRPLRPKWSSFSSCSAISASERRAEETAPLLRLSARTDRSSSSPLARVRTRTYKPQQHRRRRMLVRVPGSPSCNIRAATIDRSWRAYHVSHNEEAKPFLEWRATSVTNLRDFVRVRREQGPSASAMLTSALSSLPGH